MASEPIDSEIDPFAGKPVNRLVWILPSVMLHVILIGIWLVLPEEEFSKPKKEVVISSEQVEQLKEHVEDGNLQELHLEVQRLQAIKQEMADIRAVELVKLGEFEDEMRGSVNTDAGQSLAELSAVQDALFKAQDATVQEQAKLVEVFKAIQPMVASKNFAELVPNARQALEIRNGLKPKFEELDRQSMLLQAKLDAAEAVLGWVKDSEVVSMWQKLVTNQERVMVLQAACSEELGQLQNNQSNALKQIVDGNGNISARIKQALDQKQNGQADYEAQMKFNTDTVRTSEIAEKELSAKLAEIVPKIAESRKDRNLWGKERQRSGSNMAPDGQTLTGQERINAIDKKIKEVDRLTGDLLAERNTLNEAYQNAKNTGNQAANKLKHLRPPTEKSKMEAQRMIDGIEKTLNSLSAGAGNVAAQVEARDLQMESLRQTTVLIEVVKKQKEASQ